MHTRNITVLQEEAQRLIALEQDILERMLLQPGVLGENAERTRGTFARPQTERDLDTLRGEATKLQQLDFVIAVVGTMKAGKSTTINAIVGTEILPNRNRPMTALPTLIRHTMGQVEPKLNLPNSAPIERLAEQLLVAAGRASNRTCIEALVKDKDMAALMHHIESRQVFATTYYGAEEIFGFLRKLNDLVRLSAELDVQFPFSDYEKIHEIPVISVAFAHLPDTSGQGTLTLLDTPGPNEAGQPHLRKMLNEQLASASAVLAILDYTQLKSEADAQIQEELKEIASIAEGRMYALVNKYDQADRNGDSAEETRRFVAESLTQGRIAAANIYPVSSKQAYLANRARTTIAAHNELPSASEHPWVADFGEEAFGRRWEKSIDDAQQVREEADELWTSSRFADPIDNVIRFAQGRAAILALSSAAAKLLDTANRLANFFNTRETALGKSSRELQQQIEALQRDIDRVGEHEKDARKFASNTLKELQKESNAMFRSVKAQVGEAINRMFSERKEEERQASADQEKESPARSGAWSMGGFFGVIMGVAAADRRAHDTPHFDAERPVMTFSSRSEAETKLLAVQDEMNRIIVLGESSMKTSMSGALTVFQQNFSENVLVRARGLIDEMRSRLKDDGFELRLDIPEASTLSLPASGAQLLGDLISEKTETRNRRRRQDGAWGKICSWIKTDDWGWEEYTDDVDVYEIDARKIRKSIDKDIEAVFDGLDDALAEKIRLPLQKGIDEFFHRFKETVEDIRGDLMLGLKDIDRTRSEQEDLLRHLAELKKNIPAIQSDSDGLKQDVSGNLDAGGITA